MPGREGAMSGREGAVPGREGAVPGREGAGRGPCWAGGALISVPRYSVSYIVPGADPGGEG